MNFLFNNILIHSIRSVLRFLPRHLRRQSLVVLLLLFVNSGLELLGLGALIPLFNTVLNPDAFSEGSLINDAYIYSGLPTEESFIIALSSTVILLILIKNLVSVWISYVQNRFAFRAYKELAVRSFGFYFTKQFLYFKSVNSNQIVRNINVIPSNFANHMVVPLISLLNEIGVLALIVISLIIYNPTIVTLLAVVVIPVFWLFFSLTKKRTKYIGEKVNELGPELNNNLFQSIFGYVDVMITNTLRGFRKIYFRHVGETTSLSIQLNVLKLLPSRVIEMSMMLAILVIVVYGVLYLPDRGSLTNLLLLFSLAAYRLMPSVNRIMMAMISVRTYQYLWEYLEGITDFKEQASEEVPVALPFTKAVQLDNLGFAYPDTDKQVIRDLTFSIEHGETLGIVGRSGSGKTTLINLMLGFLQPTSGKIIVDDTPIGEHNIANWRRLIGYVQQDVYLVDGTIAQNVAFSMESDHIDETKVWEALRNASLDDLVKGFPKGIHTKVGERGSQLSGGQRQRIGIARALYSGAQVLFFDEATSALDNETEEEITESISKLSEMDLTIVIIAHRVTTLKYCSRIIEMEEGGKVNTTNYQQLLQRVT